MPTQSTTGPQILVSISDEVSDVDGRPSDPLCVQQVPNQGTHDLPDDVELVAKHPMGLAGRA
jgi:hypothetical protein